MRNGQNVLFLMLLLSAILLYPADHQNTNIQLNIQFQHFSYKDGLPSTPYTMCHDHLGYIWFGCAHGACQYDGYEFKLFEARSDTVWPRTKRNMGICEDQDGNIWIAELNYGISKLDRMTGLYTHFVHDANDSTTLSTNNTIRFFLDTHGYLWIACAKEGKYSPVIYLDRMDTRTGKVKRYRHDPEDETAIGGDAVFAWGNGNVSKLNIMEDTKSNLWIGIWHSGVNRYNRDTDTFTRFRHDSNDSTSLSSDSVAEISRSKNGDIWICTANGVNRYHYETNSFERFVHKPGNDNSLSKGYYTYAFQDNANRMWISHEYGFDTIDLSNGKINHVQFNRSTESAVPRRPYLPVYADRYGYIWFAFTHLDEQVDGLSIYNPKLNLFHYYEDDRDSHDGLYLKWFYLYGIDHSDMNWTGSSDKILNKTNPNTNRFFTIEKGEDSQYSLLSNSVRFIRPGKKDSVLWLGTSNGLTKYSWTTGKFEHFVNDPQNPNSLCNNTVTGVAEDESGDLWITTIDGLSKMDSLGNFVCFKHKIGDSTTLSDNLLFYGLEYDRNGFLWICTFHSGLNRLDLKNNKIKQFTKDENDPSSLDTQGEVYHVYNDKAGDLWVATDGGISRYNYEKENFSSILKGITPIQFFEDRWNNFWVGTFFNGVIRLNRRTGEYHRFRADHPLTQCAVSDIVEDDDGALWISTNKGLVKYFPPDSSYMCIREEHGLPESLDLTVGAKRHDGQIVWGTWSKGLVQFDPKSIQLDQNPPRVVISDIKISNESLPIGGDSPLKLDISSTSRLELRYNQNDISFICAALHYVKPSKNQYAFWLENYDDDWYKSGTTRTATYTNLDPGKYMFHVKAANSDGLWNEKGRSLSIIIHPPWYATIWAYTIYILIVAGIVYVIWTTQLRRIRLRDALQLKQVEAKKLQEIDHMKTQFIANISHEFRTPLTLILGPIESMLSKIKDADILSNMTIMRRNAKRLQRLVNQLLDLSKIEAGKLALQVQENNIIPFVNRIVQTFESQAKFKNVRLSFKAEKKHLSAYYDHEKMENVLYNLISNAIKFTPEKGCVKVTVTLVSSDSRNFQNKSLALCGEVIEILVTDTGKGIAKEHLNNIFNRFYQVDDKIETTNAGTGIGLSLTKELVELHYGEIFVESTPAKGSQFNIYLPLGKKHLQDHEILQSTAPILDGVEIGDQQSFQAQPVVSENINSDSSTLLIVEDNADLRIYIKSILNSQYRIKEAKNGKDGLEKALTILPDLIISDVMMPIMDGFDFCKKIKTDERVSHIPVILLTARANMKSKIQGLDTGADDYIIKPFDETELNARVKNLIAQRQHLRARFGQDILMPLKDITITSVDERFLSRAVDVIGENLTNPELGPDFLGAKLGASRSQLHRKLKAIVNLSTTEFIRSIRLRRAAELVKNNFGSMTEIAYEVGFNNPAHFSRYFRLQFGCTPNKFRQKNSQ
jgi:signal transduction histidine kinase/ligand-binding sensor domain-containing protein/DNA-binding response OmpR family regulator